MFWIAGRVLRWRRNELACVDARVGEGRGGVARRGVLMWGVLVGRGFVVGEGLERGFGSDGSVGGGLLGWCSMILEAMRAFFFGEGMGIQGVVDGECDGTGEECNKDLLTGLPYRLRVGTLTGVGFWKSESQEKVDGRVIDLPSVQYYA